MSGCVRIIIDGKSWPAMAGRPRQPVLGEIDLTIERGSFVVLTGPSGCGKSTLLNIVAGLDQDYSGKVSFDPPDPAMTYVFQSPRLLPWRTVFQNVALALPEGDPRVSEIPELLARVGLADAAEGRAGLGVPAHLAVGDARGAGAFGLHHAGVDFGDTDGLAERIKSYNNG